MKKNIRLSFLLFFLVLSLAIVEKIVQNVEKPISTPRTISSPDHKSGFFLTLVNHNPINFISESFEPNRTLYFYFEQERFDYDGLKVKWFLNDKFINEQKCLIKEKCIASISSSKLSEGLLSLDLFYGQELILSSSIEIESKDFSNLSK